MSGYASDKNEVYVNLSTIMGSTTFELTFTHKNKNCEL